MTQRFGTRRARILATVLAVLLLAWAVVAVFLVPFLIRQAYAGESLTILNRVISGQATHTVDDYLAVWSRVALWSSLGLLLLGVVIFIGDAYRRSLGEFTGRIVQPILVRSANDPAWLALFGLACGMFGGYVQAVAVAIRSAGLPTGDIYWERFWMAPAANAIVWGLLGVVLTLVLWPGRRRHALEIAPFVLLGFVTYDAGRSVAYGIHPLAVALIALGLTIQITRKIARSSLPRAFMAKASIVMTVLMALLATGGWAFDAGLERLGVARLGDAADDAPNVLFIILDTVRAENLSLYGYERRTTPELEAFSRDGAVFDLAISPAPWTLPAHASMFTGRKPSELSADFVVPLDAEYPTIAEVLRGHGYLTAGFVANRSYAGRPSGLDRGFDRYEDSPVNLLAFLRSARTTSRFYERLMIRTGQRARLKFKTAEQVTDSFLDWLGDASDRPFFAFLNYFDAHDPYVPPASFERRFSEPDDVAWFGGHRKSYSPTELQQLEATYDDGIAYIDQELGRMFRELDSRGILDNTIVIVTADHGEQLGEYAPDLAGHGKSLYLQELHVPLLIRAGGRVPGGVRVARPVSTRSLPGTIVELAGLPSDDVFPGPSLVRTLNRTGSGSSAATATSSLTVNTRWQLPASNPASLGPMQAIVVDTLHLIRNGDGTVELYNVLRDRDEFDDLGESPALKARLDSLEALLGPTAGTDVAATSRNEP